MGSSKAFADETSSFPKLLSTNVNLELSKNESRTVQPPITNVACIPNMPFNSLTQNNQTTPNPSLNPLLQPSLELMCLVIPLRIPVLCSGHRPQPPIRRPHILSPNQSLRAPPTLPIQLNRCNTVLDEPLERNLKQCVLDNKLGRYNAQSSIKLSIQSPVSTHSSQYATEKHTNDIFIENLLPSTPSQPLSSSI